MVFLRVHVSAFIFFIFVMSFGRYKTKESNHPLKSLFVLIYFMWRFCDCCHIQNLQDVNVNVCLKPHSTSPLNINFFFESWLCSVYAFCHFIMATGFFLCNVMKKFFFLFYPHPPYALFSVQFLAPIAISAVVVGFL